jgi:hypothetical protein
VYVVLDQRGDVSPPGRDWSWTRGVELPSQPLLVPRELSPDQRYVLHSLVERREDVRGEALFGVTARRRVAQMAQNNIDKKGS